MHILYLHIYIYIYICTGQINYHVFETKFPPMKYNEKLLCGIGSAHFRVSKCRGISQVLGNDL